MEPAIDPPYHILVSNSPVSNVTLSVPSPTTFSHPLIEYHYADDSPQSLLPQHPDEHVLVVDYNPNEHGSPAAHSLSPDLAVIGLKVTEAPGAGVAESGAPKNTNMYVLETIAMPEEIIEEDEYQAPHTILARFKQRNTVLRQVLDYPEGQVSHQLALDPPVVLASSPSKA